VSVSISNYTWLWPDTFQGLKTSGECPVMLNIMSIWWVGWSAGKYTTVTDVTLDWLVEVVTTSRHIVCFHDYKYVGREDGETKGW